MKTLRRRPGAVKSARYRIILFVISGAVLLQVPSWPGRMTLTGLRALANSGRAKLGSGTSSAFQMGEDHYLRIPYFTESDGMDSTLTLNNNMPETMSATVTLFSKQGIALAMSPISLEPFSPARLSLGELSAGARGDFSSGNLQVFFHGASMAVTSQVSIISAAKRLAFESVESEAMDFSSSKLDGIVWLPDEETRGSLVLTNTTVGELSVVGRTNRPGGSEAKTFTLGGHETRLVDVGESFGIKGAGVSALVSLEHTGSPGALIVTAFAANPGTGFSTNLVFSDRSTAVSTHLAGAHVRFGNAAVAEGFAPGTTFRAPLVIANAGSEATNASLFLDYTAGPQAGRLALGQMNLAAGGLKQIDIPTEMARRGVVGPVDDAGIDVNYTGAPGSVIARLVSVNQTGDLSYDVPVKDPLAGGPSRATGGYPWRLDAGYTTVVHLKNTINKPVEGIVQVRYERGNYNPQRLRLGPYQTVAVDIRQLRDAQQKDIRGGVMPEDVTSGQVKWLEIEPGSLIGRAEVANIGAGVASTFSCSSSGCGASFFSSSLSPSSLSGLYGNTATVSALEIDEDSNGTFYGPYDKTGSATWSSTNTSVATVSAGIVAFVGVGSCTINASWSATVYVGPNCETETQSVGTGGGVTVQPTVQITFNDSGVPLCSADNPPAPGAAAYVCSITVTAQGNPAGGSYSWSTTSNAVTLSNSTSQTVTVIGSSESSSRGDVAIVVTYTVNQQPNTAQIQTTVQKPTSMGFVGVNYDRRITDPRCHDTGWEKEIKWQVQDRWGSPMKFAMGTWDTLTNSPNNCFLPTQGEGTLPTAGLATASDGSWVHDYALCSSACNTGNCQVTGTQSYTVNGYQINLSYTMTCNSITVSGH